MKIYLKKPSGRRKSYAIYRREKIGQGKTKNVTIENSDLETLNQSNLPEDIKFKNAMLIKTSIEKSYGLGKSIVIHNEDNERVLNEFWSQKYKRRKFLVDSKTSRYDFNRAIKALKNISIVSGSDEEIENAIESCNFSLMKRRRILGKLQLLLNFLHRNIILNKPPKEKQTVSYVDEDEFLINLSRIQDVHLKTLSLVLFYTGIRLGEAFALSEIKCRFKNQYIIIDSQIDKHGKLRAPKWRKSRKAFISQKAFKPVKDWLGLIKTFPYSRLVANKRFKKAFGHHLTLHDLRHSYAVALLAKGVPIAHVAQSLGNSVKVCEEYYVGFELVDESIETIKKLVDS